jgi:hypothetical protein
MMKSNARWIALVALGLSLPMVCLAQRARQINWQVTVKEIRMDRIRNVDPGYRFPGITADNTSEWIRIYAVFDVQAEGSRFTSGNIDDAQWASNVEFDWSVVLPREYKGKLHPKYSRRLKRKVVYDAMHEGQGHVAMLFVHPRTYERFRKDLSRDMAMVQLQIRVDGKTRAECWARGRDFAESRKEAAKMFPEFGRSPIWFDWEEVPTATGLTSRMATPWAHTGRFFRILREEGN